MLNERTRGGSLPSEAYFADQVMVLVRKDKRACVLETRQAEGPDFLKDPGRDRLVCPK